MCACRCGINVYLKDGTVRYIEGNRDHPVNKGVICGKGAAGIMQHYSPARLCEPLLRVGRARFRRISRAIDWEEALAHRGAMAVAMSAARDPRKLAFFTGRDQSQALDRLVGVAIRHPQLCRPWRLLLGQHGGGRSLHLRRLVLGIRRARLALRQIFPAVRRRRGPCLQSDQERASASLKARGAKIVSVNPVRTGYSAIADEWIGIRPGTDGLLVGALIHELLKAGQVDLDYLARYTNAPWLVIMDEGSADHGLFARFRGRTAGASTAAMAARALPRDPQVRAGAPWRDPPARRPPRRAGVPPAGRALSCRAECLARRRRRALRRSGRHHPAARRRACRYGIPAGDRARRRRGRDVAGRRHDEDGRPPRRDACHARHLGPFQRLSHLPRHPSSCSSFSAPSMCRAAFATSHPFPKPRRRR